MGANGFVREVMMLQFASMLPMVVWSHSLLSKDILQRVCNDVVIGNDFENLTILSHSLLVSTLSPGIESGMLISGSWDKTAIVWKIAGFGEAQSIKLEGHEAAVWSVCALKSGKIVTGSADKSIIYWVNQLDK